MNDPNDPKSARPELTRGEKHRKRAPAAPSAQLARPCRAPGYAALGYAEFDSWLTVGITDGTQGPISASPGFDLGAWTDSAGISETNAAIFFMDPATMGANSGSDPIVMAQMTVSAETAAGGTATAKLQGRSAGGAEDWESPVVWTW